MVYDFDYYIKLYLDTRKNKRRGADSMLYEVDWVPRLVRDIRKREDKSLRIDSNYAFLVSRPKWREIFATEFGGRLIDHEICDRLHSGIESTLSDRTYNNRIGYGSQAAINKVIEDMYEVSNGYTSEAWVIKIDLKGYFPSAIWGVANKMIDDVIERAYSGEDVGYLRWLSMISINSNPAAHCELRTAKYLWKEHIDADKSLLSAPEGRGAAIGRLIWQTAMGLYINDEIKWLSEDCGLKVVCFVDDIVIQVPARTKDYAISLIPRLRSRLKSKGIMLNEKKFYCQPYWRGLEFLGSHIKPWRIHLNNETYNRFYGKILWFNSIKDKYRHIDEFISMVNSYCGLLKNRTDFKRLLSAISAVDEQWWQWLTWNENKTCIRYKDEYSPLARLNNKYNLKLKKYDSKRKAGNT